MKKFLAILLTVFYFGSSSGMVFNLHYCLDEIFVSLTSTDKTCDICGTSKKKDCCKSEVKIAKTDVAQKANLLSLDTFAAYAVIVQNVFPAFSYPILQQNYFAVRINAPPEKAIPALFLTYCNFRI